MDPERYYLKTFGCTLNQFDSQMLEDALENSSLRRVMRARDADVIIVNTCAVKQQTEDKIISYLKKLSRLDKRLVVTGCLPDINGERLESEVAPDAVTGVSIGEDIIDLVGGNNGAEIKPSSPPPLSQKRPNGGVTHITATSTGCLSNCSFCGTKAARGSLTSYPEEEILADVRRAVRGGAREVWLTGVDQGPYGMDLRDGSSLPSLVRGLEKITGEFIARLGMANPRFLKDYINDLVGAFKDTSKVYSFLHVPVQSGSDQVLRIMKRGHTVQDYIDIVETARRELGDNCTIATDIIVGHPGETEEDFQDTVNLIRRTEPDIVNISKFFPRPDTEAKEMDRVPTETIKERSTRLTRLVHCIGEERNKSWHGWRGSVLINESGKRGMVGRNYAYKPVVVREDLQRGESIDVEIVDSSSTWLLGEPLT